MLEAASLVRLIFISETIVEIPRQRPQIYIRILSFKVIDFKKKSKEEKEYNVDSGFFFMTLQ